MLGMFEVLLTLALTEKKKKKETTWLHSEN